MFVLAFAPAVSRGRRPAVSEPSARRVPGCGAGRRASPRGVVALDRDGRTEGALHRRRSGARERLAVTATVGTRTVVGVPVPVAAPLPPLPAFPLPAFPLPPGRLAALALAEGPASAAAAPALPPSEALPEPWPAPFAPRPAGAAIALERCAAGGTAVVVTAVLADDTACDVTVGRSSAPRATPDAAAVVDTPKTSWETGSRAAAGAANSEGQRGRAGTADVRR